MKRRSLLTRHNGGAAGHQRGWCCLDKLSENIIIGFCATAGSLVSLFIYCGYSSSDCGRRAVSEAKHLLVVRARVVAFSGSVGTGHHLIPGWFLEDLRERCFGANLEPKSHNHYLEIWKFDARDPLVGPEGGESVVDVAMRVIRALLRIEEEVQGHAVVIVSHGDTLQILQTVINHALGRVFTVNDSLLTRLEEAISPSILQRHRNFAVLTAELRPRPDLLLEN